MHFASISAPSTPLNNDKVKKVCFKYLYFLVFVNQIYAEKPVFVCEDVNMTL